MSEWDEPDDDDAELPMPWGCLIALIGCFVFWTIIVYAFFVWVH